MPFPCPVDLHVQFHQPIVAGANVAFYRVFRGSEDFVAPGRLVEEDGEWRVAFFRFPPYTLRSIAEESALLASRRGV